MDTKEEVWYDKESMATKEEVWYDKESMYAKEEVWYDKESMATKEEVWYDKESMATKEEVWYDKESMDAKEEVWYDKESMDAKEEVWYDKESMATKEEVWYDKESMATKEEVWYDKESMDAKEEVWYDKESMDAKEEVWYDKESMDAKEEVWYDKESMDAKEEVWYDKESMDAKEEVWYDKESMYAISKWKYPGYVFQTNRWSSNLVQDSYWSQALENCVLMPVQQNNSCYKHIDHYWTKVSGIVNENGLKRLFCLVKCIMSLNHGNASPERGFSINKLMLECYGYTMEKNTISALRLVHHVDGVLKFPITKDLMEQVKGSRAKYISDLEQQETSGRERKEREGRCCCYSWGTTK